MAEDKDIGAQEGGKEGKKGAVKKSKKKITDPFTKKEWYEIKAPDLFLNRKVGKMPVSKSSGQDLAEDSLKGRIVEVNLADLQKDEDQSHRKIFLRVEEVQGKYCLTNFYGMDFTTDKLRSLVRKWQTMIEASTDVKTTDGYLLRLFCIGFTKRRPNQQKKTCYAQGSQIHAIRAKMTEIMRREASSVTLRELVLKFIPEAIGGMIQKETNGIFPLQHVYIRRVKLLSSPKFDAQALRELHDKSELAKMEADDAGEAVKAAAGAAEGEKKPEGEAAKEGEKKPAEGEKKPEGEKKGGEKKDAGKGKGEKPAEKKGGEKGGAKGGEKAAQGGEKKPAEKKPAEKPAEKKGGEKPAEKKPAEKPAEKKGGEKPAEKKGGEKPAEKKPAEKPAEKKGGEKPAEKKPAEKKGGEKKGGS